MAKLVIDPITSGYNISKINAALQAIVDEINNKVLYRANPAGEPNSLANDVDFNSNDLLNANVVAAQSVTIGGVSVVPGDTLSVPNASVIPNTPAGNISAVDVQAAINELDTEKEPADATILKDADIGVNVQAYDANLSINLYSTTLTHNMTSDADYTLSAAENLNGRIVVTDTSVLLTTGRNIVVADTTRVFIVLNSTAQTLTFKTAAGTGISVLAGESSVLACEGTNVIDVLENYYTKGDIYTKSEIDARYQPISGTVQASTSGTSIDFTSIPSWAKRISVQLDGVSTSGTDKLIIQLGDSGGLETTGYVGSSSRLGSTSTNTDVFTTGIGINNVVATAVMSGFLVFELLDSSTNTWVASGSVGRSDSASVIVSAGSKSLSAALDRIRITTLSGTNTFDAGKINLLYE